MADKTEAEIKEDAARKDAERKDADVGTLLKTAIDAIGACSSKVDALGKRMDSYDAKDDAHRKDAAARKDAEEKEEKEKAEREDAARKDAERKDAERRDASRKDETPEEKEKREKEERDDAARKDAARKDAEEKEEKEKQEREDAARKDARSRDDAASTKLIEGLQTQIAELNSRLPKPFADADFYAVSDSQARADEVYVALGERAPIPRQGETVDMYERRVVRDLKKHSARWKDLSDVSTGVFADSAAFNNVRDQVYADAKAFGVNPANITPGQLREKISTQGGHEFHEFYGHPNDWMDDFSGRVQLKAEGKWMHNFSGRQYASGINLRGGLGDRGGKNGGD